MINLSLNSKSLAEGMEDVRRQCENQFPGESFNSARLQIEVFINYEGDVYLYGKYVFSPLCFSIFIFGYAFNIFNAKKSDLAAMKDEIIKNIKNERCVTVNQRWDDINNLGFLTEIFDEDFYSMLKWKLLRKKAALKLAAGTIDKLNNIYTDIGKQNRDYYGFFVSDPIQRKQNIENYQEEYRRAREEQARNER